VVVGPLHDPRAAVRQGVGTLQRFAVKLNHTASTHVLAQEVFSEEDHALIARAAQ
jgi:hypothetical protein